MTLAFSPAEQRIELALAVERVELVTAADMGLADEDLRKGRAVRRRDRPSPGAQLGSLATSNSVNARLLARQQRLWRRCNSRSSGGCRFRSAAVMFALALRNDCTIIWDFAGVHNPGKDQHVDLGAPGAQQRPRTGVDRGARGQHIVDQHHPAALRSRRCARARPGTRPAHCWRARFRDSPTCCRVGRTRRSASAATVTPRLPRDRAGQRAGLVEAAAPGAPPVQRHRHQQRRPRRGVRGRRAPSSGPSSAPDRCGPGISAHAPACGRRRHSEPRRGRADRPADRRSPPSTAGRGPDRRQRECRAAGKMAAR